MATLRLTVLFPSAVLPETEANRHKVFMFSATVPTYSGTFGNLNTHTKRFTDLSVDFNNPQFSGTISVSAHSHVTFESEGFSGDQPLADSMSDAIEAGYVELVLVSAPGSPLDRSDIQAYVDA